MIIGIAGFLCSSMPSGAVVYRTFGFFFEGYNTVVGMAARTPGDLVSSTSLVTGNATNAVGYDGATYYSTFSGELHLFGSIADLASKTNQLASSSHTGSSADALFYDGSSFYRVYSGSLERYSTAANAAARTTILTTSGWTGADTDGIFCDGTFYYRSNGVIGGTANTIEKYATAVDAGRQTSVISSSYLQGDPTDKFFSTTPIPEPSSLLISGLAIFGVMRRRRNA